MQEILCFFNLFCKLRFYLINFLSLFFFSLAYIHALPITVYWCQNYNPCYFFAQSFMGSTLAFSPKVQSSFQTIRESFAWRLFASQPRSGHNRIIPRLQKNGSAGIARLSALCIITSGGSPRSRCLKFTYTGPLEWRTLFSWDFEYLHAQKIVFFVVVAALTFLIRFFK